jgi:hypothetical protein
LFAFALPHRLVADALLGVVHNDLHLLLRHGPSKPPSVEHASFTHSATSEAVKVKKKEELRLVLALLVPVSLQEEGIGQEEDCLWFAILIGHQLGHEDSSCVPLDVPKSTDACNSSNSQTNGYPLRFNVRKDTFCVKQLLR